MSSDGGSRRTLPPAVGGVGARPREEFASTAVPAGGCHPSTEDADASPYVDVGASGTTMRDPLAELRPHERKLLGYIARRHGDRTRAEDVLQETLLNIMQQSRKQEIANPLAYAYRVADSLIYAEGRRGRREQALVPGEDYGCDLPLADEVLEHKQRVAIFESALARLSPVRRQVFARRHLDGQSRQAIADSMGLSLEAVKKHLVRAMVELADAMDAATGESPEPGRPHNAR